MAYFFWWFWQIFLAISEMNNKFLGHVKEKKKKKKSCSHPGRLTAILNRVVQREG